MFACEGGTDVHRNRSGSELGHEHKTVFMIPAADLGKSIRRSTVETCRESVSVVPIRNQYITDMSTLDKSHSSNLTDPIFSPRLRRY